MAAVPEKGKQGFVAGNAGREGDEFANHVVGEENVARGLGDVFRLEERQAVGGVGLHDGVPIHAQGLSVGGEAQLGGDGGKVRRGKWFHISMDGNDETALIEQRSFAWLCGHGANFETARLIKRNRGDERVHDVCVIRAREQAVGDISRE